MKLIIDIPNYDLNLINNGSIACSQILRAVKKGIPYEERPHGEWKKRTIGYLSTHECSNCDFNGDWLWNFCPNCGAKMQKEW